MSTEKKIKLIIEEDDDEIKSVESHDELDDHGVMCHYSRTTGGWEAIEPFCVECGYGDDNCECEEEKTNCECSFPKFNVVDGIYTCRWCELPDHYKNGIVSDWSDSEDEDEDQDDFTNRICGFCNKDFDLKDPHYYDEENGECYCNEDCYNADNGETEKK
jgi:hypothetical protein